MGKAYSYTAYGLNISSFMPIGEFIKTKKKPQVRILLGKVNHIQKEKNKNFFHASQNEIQLHIKKIGKFSIQKGRKIIVDPAPCVTYFSLRPYIRGPILAMLLYQRGLLLLHASTVLTGDSCVSFLGGSGLGKSTIAATFNVNGHKVLAEDITAINFENGRPYVIPAFPLLKLNKDIASIIGTRIKKLKRQYKHCEKFSYKTNGTFQKDPVVLKRIYLLTKDNETKELKKADALLELVRHSYVSGVAHILDPSSHFLKCANLANKVPVYNLARCTDLKKLPILIKTINKELKK